MAERLATEYVKARLQVSEQELAMLARVMGDQNIRLEMRVLENGNHEMALEDVAAREEIRLTFERQHDGYVCELSCRLLHPKLTNAMRKAVSMFKGDALVNRIYPTYTMVYQYHKGAVHRIVEVKGGESRVVFQIRDTAGQLERQFRNRSIEERIERVQSAVNELLDLRNQTRDPAEIASIDERLKEQTQLLFMLEA